MAERHLDWAGCFNVRDLGGLPTRDGRVTRWSEVVRADSLDRLSPDGWAALHAYGIRTVVDLRESDERTAEVSRPAGVTVVHVPLDDNGDADFWYRCIDDDTDGTPLYYRPFLERKAERCVAAIAAVARAGPGGVAVHCGIGRDRTGLVSLVLLALAGVAPEAIIADYALSGERLRRYFDGADDDPVVTRLAERGTTIAEAIHELLTGLDIETRLRAAGLTAQLLGAGRALLAAAVRHAGARTQFGRPVGQFQAVKHRLADVAIALEFARPLLYGAAVALAGDAPTAGRDTSAAKVACTDAAERAARAALQVHGAIGYAVEGGIAGPLTKVRALRAAWGTPSAHRARIMAALTDGKTS